MQRNGPTRILVHRDGCTFDDGIICDGDQVKCDGWRNVRDLALYEAKQIGAHDPTKSIHDVVRLCGSDGSFDLGYLGPEGHWAVWDGNPYVPSIHSPSEFQRDFELAGVSNGTRLYRRTSTVKVFQWSGEANLTIYRERGGRECERIVRPGDFVLALDDGSYRALTKAWAEAHLEL